jgi:hypothetical protein
MELENLVDVEQLSARLAKERRNVFHYWTATALEICSTEYKSITNLKTIYMEIPDSELRADQILTFVRELLRIMPSLEEKKTLLRTEAIQEIKFEKAARHKEGAS